MLHPNMASTLYVPARIFFFSTTKLVRSGLLGYVGTVLFFLLRMFFNNNKYQREEDLLVERARQGVAKGERHSDRKKHLDSRVRLLPS